jgi:aryl-alcohol dehydrogenase-like predicted oxidoreductase
MSDRASFVAVEHAMNVFFDAPKIQSALTDSHLTALIRSPLAMGLLSGKYGANDVLPKQDVRASGETWMEYYTDGKPNLDYLKKLDAIRDLLMLDGRSIVQGALSWIWAKGDANVPIPGARTVEQIQGLARALSFGPLPQSAMTEIETLISRDPDAEERPR